MKVPKHVIDEARQRMWLLVDSGYTLERQFQIQMSLLKQIYEAQKQKAVQYGFISDPERLLMQSRASVECNQLAVRAELKSMYCRKAWRCGMSLDGYCERFGITKVWEAEHGELITTA